MKRGERIPVSVTAQRPPVRMYSYMDAGLHDDPVVIPAGTILYHVSAEQKLATFAPCETCFSLYRPVLTGHVYILIPRRDIPARQMDDVEIRVDLAVVAGVVDIYYAGTRKMDFRQVCVDNFNRVVYVPRRCRFAAQFRHLAAEIEAAERKENQHFYSPAYRWVAREEA